jgi:hypothetical protein
MSKRKEAAEMNNEDITTTITDAGDWDATPAAEPPSPVIKAVVQAPGAQLAVRNAPDGMRIGVLDDGDTVSVVDADAMATSDWAELDEGGYVKMQYLSLIGIG